MSNEDLRCPIPVRNRLIADLASRNQNIKRAKSNLAEVSGRREKPSITSPERRALSPTFSKARSVTPNGGTRFIKNNHDSELVLDERLKNYGLDYPDSFEEYEKEIFNPISKWYSRSVKPEFSVESNLPYGIESHKDQAKYLCHIIANLYVAISSGDLEGLVPISSRDLAEFRNNVDELALNTDLFRLTGNESITDHISGDRLSTRDAEEEEENSTYDNSDFRPRGKITARSATIINVNHWTNELLNFLSYEIPLTLRKSLAVTFYYLSLVQGQKINRSMFVEVFERLVCDYDKGTNFTKLLKDHGLRLDHKPLLDFLFEFLPYPDPDYMRYELSSKSDLQFFKVLLRLSHSAKPFFDDNRPTVMLESMETLLSSLAPATISAIMPIVTAFVPQVFHKDGSITDYFPFFFGLWTSVSANVSIDAHMYDIMGSVMEKVHLICMKDEQQISNCDLEFGKYGIFTEGQMTFMFNRLQGHLRLDGQISSYSRTARSFIYSINGTDSEYFFHYLIRLVKAIETYVHPSNNGQWTKTIAKFVYGFIKLYHGRVKKEAELEKEYGKHGIQLNEVIHEKIIDVFADLLFTGAQNKSPEVTNYYISCFAYLLELVPRNSYIIYDKILLELYDMFAGEYINSRHRVISSLKQYTRVARFMVMEPLYRVHITNILLMLTAKIDMNDINLTSNIINAIVTTCSFVPFASLVPSREFWTFESHTLSFIEQHFDHLKSGNHSNTFEYDANVLDCAFRASTSAFQDIFKQYIDKLFQLVDTDLEENYILKLNQTTIMMIEASDNASFDYFAEVFLKMFWNNDCFRDRQPNYELVTIPLGVIVRRKTLLGQKVIETLILNIRDQIKRGAGSVRLSSEIMPRDVKLVLYLTALNEVLRHAHSSILKLQEDLIDFFVFLYSEVTNPPLDMITSIGIHSTIMSLTITEIADFGMFSGSCTIPLAERWGALQFDKRKYDQSNLSFKWHVPTDVEICAAIRFFNTITEFCIDKVNILMENPVVDNLYLDKIKKYILILTHTLSGSSLLFDAEANRNKLENPINWKEKLILLKNVREDNVDSEEINIDVEPIHGTVDEGYFFDDKNDSDEIPESSPDAIQIVDGDNIDLIFEDGLQSEVPSGVGTPIASNPNELSSLMNPNYIFRDLDIYGCNYFFGNRNEDKIKSTDYFKVHQIRDNVGVFLHKVYEFLTLHFENNTSVFQVLLHGMKVWFTDVGNETIFSDEPDGTIDIEFAENIQSLAHLHEPFTRSLLAVKVNEYHKMRINMRSTNRKPSVLERQLLSNIIELSVSPYPDVHRPAQNTMMHCMKQIIGSYNVILSRTMKLIRDALYAKDYLRVSAGLKILLLKKLNKKLSTEYRSSEQLFSIVAKCYDINEFDISTLANNFLVEFVNSFKVPSSICVMDSRAAKSLEPPEKSILLQVNTVRSAKARKRLLFVSKIAALQDLLHGILERSDDLPWKLVSVSIKFLSSLQSNLEAQTEKKHLNIIFEQCMKQHPSIIHTSLKSLLNIANKTISYSDYCYDISRAYQSNFDPEFVYRVDTSHNYESRFNEEINNEKDPKFYIDSKAFVGWLCWGAQMKVLKPKKIEVNLKPADFEILESLGSAITIEWLKNLTTKLISDNEGRNNFSSGEVSFFILIILLICNGASSLQLEDILNLCEQYYIKDDKAAMIMSVEIFAALICGGKYMSESDKSKRDDFVNNVLQKFLDRDFNHDSFEIWSTLSWWLPMVADVRRCPILFHYLTDLSNILNIRSDDFGKQSSRIYLLRGMLLNLEFMLPEIEGVINNLIFDHPYDQVREATAKLFTTIIQCKSRPAFTSVDELMQIQSKNQSGLGEEIKTIPYEIDRMIKKIFEYILRNFNETNNLSPQDFIKTRYFYTVSTMVYWLMDMARGSNKILLVPYIIPYIYPFLSILIQNKEVCKLTSIDPSRLFIGLSYMPIRQDKVHDMVQFFCNANGVDLISPSTSSFQLKVQLTVMKHFYSHQLFQVTSIEKRNLLDFIVSQLYNQQFVEVRLCAADVLSGLVHTEGESGIVQELVENFTAKLRDYTWEDKTKATKTDVNVHGSILGLGAIIAAFPYEFPLPDWIPEQLSQLASWARTNGMAGTAAKDIISTFKKVRTDTWQFDRSLFTSDQLDDLEGVLWRSYYA